MKSTLHLSVIFFFFNTFSYIYKYLTSQLTGPCDLVIQYSEIHKRIHTHFLRGKFHCDSSLETNIVPIVPYLRADVVVDASAIHTRLLRGHKSGKLLNFCKGRKPLSAKSLGTLLLSMQNFNGVLPINSVLAVSDDRFLHMVIYSKLHYPCVFDVTQTT